MSLGGYSCDPWNFSSWRRGASPFNWVRNPEILVGDVELKIYWILITIGLGLICYLQNNSIEAAGHPGAATNIFAVAFPPLAAILCGLFLKTINLGSISRITITVLLYIVGIVYLAVTFYFLEQLTFVDKIDDKTTIDCYIVLGILQSTILLLFLARDNSQI